MRKLDLTNYEVTIQGKPIPYFVKESMVSTLYSPQLRLNSRDLLENDRVAQKINKAEGEVLLEEEEYNRLKCAVEGISGYVEEDVKFVKRVLEAPTVEVVEK